MDQASLVEIGLPAALFLIMVGMGLTLTPKDFREVLIAPRATVYGLVAQIVLLPLVGVGLAMMLDLSPALAVGLVIIAACPGGTTSNLFVLLSRGNIALSIVLTVSASLITILTLPLFTNIALQYYMGTEEDIVLPVWKTVGMLIGIVLFPVAIGMVVRTRKPEVARKAEGIVSIFGGIVLAVLIVALVYGVRDQIWELLKQAGPATILLNLAGIGLGLAAGRMAGLTQRESLAVAVELGVKNGTIALMVTLTLLESSAMSIPAAVYGVLMFPIGFVLAMYGRSIIPISTVQSKN